MRVQWVVALLVGTIAMIVGASLFAYAELRDSGYVSDDNAQVVADLVQVGSLNAGRIKIMNVDVGDAVVEGQVIAIVEIATAVSSSGTTDTAKIGFREVQDLLVEVWNSAKNKPSPIDAYFGGVFYIGPIFTAFRGLPECVDYYKALKAEVNYRIKNKLGPVTPEGELNDQKYRIVVEGPPSWPNFRDFWKILTDEGVVMVASTYTKVGGLFEDGFRHDPDRPLESLGEYCMGCYTNHSLPARVDILEKYIKDFSADGFMIHSIKSCNSFSAGQLLIMSELEKRTGKAGVFIESDLVDPRYFSAANIKNRLESYFQMIETKRAGA